MDNHCASGVILLVFGSTTVAQEPTDGKSDAAKISSAEAAKKLKDLQAS